MTSKVDPAVQEVLDTLADAGALIRDLPQARSISIARTKVQEAIFWLLSDNILENVEFSDEPKKEKKQ